MASVVIRQNIDDDTIVNDVAKRVIAVRLPPPKTAIITFGGFKCEVQQAGGNIRRH